ncbi:MAG: hypothetical protein HY302_01200 [Opitutae bacterium]|nr:hypothetical protein [Opitutae bacterium]
MLNRLFSHKADSNDGLSQAQREAIVDLLHYCMYADNFVALSETRFIAAKVESFNWDPKISIEYYQNKSIGAARAALADPKAKERFFQSVSERLGSAKIRAMAFELCQKLFASDGSKPAGEFSTQGEIRKALSIS